MEKSSEKNENEQAGLVISYFGNSVAVETETGQIFQCHLRRNQPLPVVGDRVILQIINPQLASIVTIKPRFSQLIRRDRGDNTKSIAANMDLVAIVMAPLPIFSNYLIDRYLLAAELLNIEAMIILNKIDLLLTVQPSLEEDLKFYQALAYPVLRVSVYQQRGLSDLLKLFVKKTVVLVGPSGVGKSSIIAALNRDESIRIGETSNKGAGKHTTTATRLYHLAGGGKIIDSPGVREFNLWPVTGADIMQGFREIKTYGGKCKFRDCQHSVEPDCAVLAALDGRKISRARLANYHLLMKTARVSKK